MIGTRILLTGATRGIGRATALELVKRGAHVLATGRDEGALQSLVIQSAQHSGEIEFEAADVLEPDEIKRVVDRAGSLMGGLDVVIHSAGISPSLSRSQLLPLDEWQKVLDTNLRSALLLAQASYPYLINSDRASIVNVSSVNGSVGLPRLSAYCASKGGLDALTRSLGVEWAAKGIRVNSVAPGLVATELTADFLRDPPPGHPVERIPMGRVGRPEEIAKVIAFLASEDASYMTSTVVYVDGGYTAI